MVCCIEDKGDRARIAAVALPYGAAAVSLVPSWVEFGYVRLEWDTHTALGMTMARKFIGGKNQAKEVESNLDPRGEDVMRQEYKNEDQRQV